MTPNSLLSERFAVLARLAPQSTSGTVVSPYVGPAATEAFGRLLVLAQTGENGTGVLTATLLKASDSSGTGAAAMRTATPLTAAGGDNKDLLFDLSPDDLDPAKPFIALQMTVTADACLVAGLILGSDARFDPASDNNAASVAQIL